MVVIPDGSAYEFDPSDWEDASQENSYTKAYPLLLENCDRRVNFSNSENLRLQKLNDEVTRLSNEAETIIGTRIAEPLSQLLNDPAISKIKLKYDAYIEKARSIQQKAEKRFMKSFFGDDIQSISADAIRVIEVEKYNHLPVLTRDYLFGKTPKTKLKALFNATMYLARMHVAYSIEIGQLHSFVLSVEMKVRSYIQYDEIFNSLMDEVRDEIINDENGKLNYLLEASSQYEYILQAPPLSILSMMSSNKASIDYQNKSVSIALDGCRVTIEKFIDNNKKQQRQLDVLTLQLIDMIIIKFNDLGRKSNRFSISVEEYMSKRGIKVIQKARDQIKRSCDSISGMIISFDSDKDKNGKYRQGKTKIVDSIELGRNGLIEINLNSDFCKMLSGYAIMKYPKELFKFSENKNPNSYYLLKRILWHKNINFKHKNADIISIESLLNACPNLPKYEEISSTGQIKQRIITPFERDMNSLSKILTWEYYSRNGSLDIGTAEIDYCTFSRLLIKITWKNLFTIDSTNVQFDTLS